MNPDRFGWMVACTLLVVALLGLARPSFAGDPGEVIILDTTSNWRLHHALAPPVLRHTDGRLETMSFERGYLDAPPRLRPAAWHEPDFDDSGWLAGTLMNGVRSPFVSRQYVRGRFRVEDPGATRDLRLSLRYHGGVIVYLNGEEIARGDVAAGPLTEDSLAEAYPREAFFDDDDQPRDASRVGAEARRAFLDALGRELEVALPAEALREGVNVIGIEVVRSAYDAALADAGEGGRPWLALPTAQLRHGRLTASDGAGVAANLVRPRGLQIWNSQPLAPVFDMDWADPNQPLKPLRLVGARRGVYSGKVVLGRDEAITGLRAEIDGLTGPEGASIGAEHLRVRYGRAWGGWPLAWPYTGESQPYTHEAGYLGALEEEPAAAYPVQRKPVVDRAPAAPEGVEPRFGAVVPLWLSVSIPEDAPAGLYRGQLHVSMDGEPEQHVDVELEVIDWSLPPRNAYRTWIELVQSPDAVALEYAVELWSEEHWAKIERSFKLMGEIGTSVVYVPLLAETNMGNEQSMVRWIEQSDGSYAFDYSVMERYLDIAAEHLDTTIICFVVWDLYVGSKQRAEAGEEGQMGTMALNHLDAHGEGPVVTAVDSADDAEPGRLELPDFTDDASFEPWSALWSGVTRRLEERGLTDQAMFGLISDIWPRREEVAFWHDNAPGVPWVAHSHFGVGDHGPTGVHGIAPAGYQSRVWHVNFPHDTDAGVLRGWQREALVAYYMRSCGFSNQPASLWHHILEFTITGDQRGLGRVGADNWQAVRDRRGNRRAFTWARYPQSDWRNLNLHSHVFAPGPDGAVSTQRYEALREGHQAAEARVYIESVLVDEQRRERIGERLAESAQAGLDDRLNAAWVGSSTLRLHGAQWHYASRGMTWNEQPHIAGERWLRSFNWQDKDRKLYELAAEIAQALED